MRTARKPINSEPSRMVYDGRALIGFLFDVRDGIVATLADRLPLGTFATWFDAHRTILEAWREGDSVIPPALIVEANALDPGVSNAALDRSALELSLLSSE